MRSIQTKFIILILGCVLLCTIVIGGAGVLYSNKVVDIDSAKIVNLHCSENAKELDGQLTRIEQSVETLASYALEQIGSVDRLLLDEEYLNEHNEKLEKIAVNAANSTQGAIGVYLRYNPELWEGQKGIFWSKTDGAKTFQKMELTDFTKYSPDDVEYVGWYYIPVANGRPTWVPPYLNKNIDVYMISYVIPIYKEDRLIGIVGMDIDFSMIADRVAEMKIYDTGYAFLTDSDAAVVYHKEVPEGVYMGDEESSLVPVALELQKGSSGDTLFSYTWKGQEKRLAFRTLVNGMRLVLVAPEEEIDAEKNLLIFQISIATFCIAALSVVLTFFLTRHIIRPLKELNVAAKRIAEGDLSVSIKCHTGDEVGALAESFRQTVRHLNKYIDYINELAYKDSLTGAGNKTAYDEAVIELEQKAEKDSCSYAVVVFDVNGLKQTNDRLGHDLGDMLIVDCYNLIYRCFHEFSVYRIGGDEFVVIIENATIEQCQKKMQEFDEGIARFNESNCKKFELSIARGFAVYDRKLDAGIGSVFKRADEAMYENKVETKHK